MANSESFMEKRIDFRFSLISLLMVLVTLSICPWLLIDGMTLVKYSALLFFSSFLCLRLHAKFTLKRITWSDLGKSFSALFLLLPIISIIAFLTNSHFRSQQFFGAYGRNTGLITYLALSLVAFYFFVNV